MPMYSILDRQFDEQFHALLLLGDDEGTVTFACAVPWAIPARLREAFPGRVLPVDRLTVRLVEAEALSLTLNVDALTAELIRGVERKVTLHRWAFDGMAFAYCAFDDAPNNGQGWLVCHRPGAY